MSLIKAHDDPLSTYIHLYSNLWKFLRKFHPKLHFYGRVFCTYSALNIYKGPPYSFSGFMPDLRKIYYSSVLHPNYHLLSQTAPPSVHSLPFLQVKLKRKMKIPLARNTHQSCHNLKLFKESLLQRVTLLL